MKLKLTLALALALSAFPALRAQDHGHLNVGAAGGQLIWANGPIFIDSSGYVKTLLFTNANRYSNYFQGNITPVALSPAADSQAPAHGSYIQFSLACLEGPPGGAFHFWENTGTTPVLTLAPGQSSTNLWRLSESDGSPGSDPGGHIHGRRLTATKPGLYKIGYTAYDTSTNGPGGGPIHTPSVQLPVWFQAGVNIRKIEPDEDHTHVHFGALAGSTWQVESAVTLGTNAVWTPVGAPVAGDDYFHEVDDDTPVSGLRIYRVRRVTP